MAADAERYASAFGRALAKQIERRNMSQRAFASAAGISPSYANHTMSGRKPASPKFADHAADVLRLKEGDRVALHRAAAQDAGYKLDLSQKVPHGQ